jgi:cell wall-associated NlpC family hydrolase
MADHGVFDPRLTPARPDLAAKQLEGRIEAARFVEGRTYEIAEPQAPMRRAPSPEAALDTEALKGERVTIYETTDEGWAWGQLAIDGYVGYLPAGALAPPGPAPTHKVVALRTLVFPGPSIKLPPVEAFALGCRLAIAHFEAPFAVTVSGGYLPERHLAAIDAAERDFVAVAERFLGAPYLWGGKTSLGLDCSGLVQVALAACGITCPRDSDMQEKTFAPAPAEKGVESRLGLSQTGANALTALDPSYGLQRGDLLFWEGHVGIARDAATLIHANAFHMAVAIEPIAEAIARIGADGSEVTSIRRPPQRA